MIRRPPRSTRMTHPFPTRRSSDLELGVAIGLDMGGAGGRVSRYETGKHEVKLGLQKLFAKALALPLNYFYIEDDEEARLIAEARSEEHTSELQSLMRISYAVFCLKKTNKITYIKNIQPPQV